jgi:DNA polymerase
MKLTTRIRKCTKCKELAATRQNVVIGDGPIPCPIVFLGEAPGRKEDQTGIPFWGMAGDVLTTFAFKYKLNRGVDYHILNVLKCMPPANRDAHLSEYENCTPFLDQQLKAVNPQVVVALGRYAQAYILKESPHKISVLKNMGTIVKRPDFYAVLSCHPTFVARNRNIIPAFKGHIRKAKQIAEGRIPKCSVRTVE